MERTPVESLRKGLEVLELLSRARASEGIPLAEIASRMGYKRNTAHNLLKTLVMCGYAVNDGDGRYRIGRKVGQLIRNRHAGGPLPVALHQPLVQLAAELDESVVLTTLAGGSRRVLARAVGQQMIQVDANRLDGEHTQMWSTVTGRILAAFASPEELDELIDSEGVPAENWGGLRTRPALDEALRAMRKQGFAESHERSAASVAVPLLEGGVLLGALGIHLPEFRWREESRQPYLQAMRRTAERLARLWHE